MLESKARNKNGGTSFRIASRSYGITSKVTTSLTEAHCGKCRNESRVRVWLVLHASPRSTSSSQAVRGAFLEVRRCNGTRTWCWNLERIIEAELIGAPAPIDLTIEDFVDVDASIQVVE